MRANVWIRKTNEDAWKALGKGKSRFVNEALEGKVVPIVAAIREANEDQKKIMEAPPVDEPAPKLRGWCRQHQMEKEVCKLMKHV